MRRGMVSLVVAAAAALSGCFGLQEGDVAQFVFGATAYGYEATVSFGFVEPEGSGRTLSGRLENLTVRDIVIESVELTGSDYDLTLPSRPFTIAPGESVAASLTFAPTASGTSTGSIEVGIGGNDTPFAVNLQGVGNYPPVARPAVIVSGAGTEAVNGTYVREGTLTTFTVRVEFDPESEVEYASPTYELPGTVYKIWAMDNDGSGWIIDDDYEFDFGEAAALYGPYFFDPWISEGLIPPSGSWTLYNIEGPEASVTSEIDSPSGGLAYAGETVTATYLFVDAEDDEEGETTFQWYSSATLDGEYTAITGATSDSYEVTSADVDTYLKVEVTPVAASGVREGAPVMLGPMFVWQEPQ